MMYFRVRLNCGCCTAALAFRSADRFLAAVSPPGLTSSGRVVDDEGTEHTGLDTFYGYTDATTHVRRTQRRARKGRGKKRGGN